MYIPTSSIKPWSKRECVVPKYDISQEERTNAWTVCLTTRGVVGYLNKRISPLGELHDPDSASLQSRPLYSYVEISPQVFG